MASERSPAFRFYAKDWRDVKVRRMSLAAQGAYMAILADMWVDSKDQCSLLDCNPFIAKALGVTEQEWLALRAEIQHADEPLLIEKNGRLYSQRLKDEAEKQRKYAESQSERAHKRWDATAMPRHSHGSTEPHAKTCSSSSSSSSSSEKNKKKMKSVNARRHALENFELTVEHQAWAKEELGVVIPSDIFTEFKHYWLDLPNNKLRSDWESTFRNRIRKLVNTGVLKSQPLSILLPQTRCAYANEPCEEYAMAGSRYCQKHKDVIERAKASRFGKKAANHPSASQEIPQPANVPGLRLDLIGKTM